MKCHKFYDAEYICQSKEIPHCKCGGIIKPDVVLYQEGLDDNTVEKSVQAIIVGGTSLNVYPAAGLIQYRKRTCKLVLINKTKTSADIYCDLVIHDSLGKIFAETKIN